MDKWLTEIPCGRCGTFTREIKQVPANGHHYCFKCYDDSIAGTWQEELPRTVTKAAKEIGPGDEIVWFYFPPEGTMRSVIARRVVIDAFTEYYAGETTTSIWLESNLPKPIFMEVETDHRLQVIVNE